MQIMPEKRITKTNVQSTIVPNNDNNNNNNKHPNATKQTKQLRRGDATETCKLQTKQASNSNRSKQTTYNTNIYANKKRH